MTYSDTLLFFHLVHIFALSVSYSARITTIHCDIIIKKVEWWYYASVF